MSLRLIFSWAKPLLIELPPAHPKPLRDEPDTEKVQSPGSHFNGGPPFGLVNPWPRIRHVDGLHLNYHVMPKSTALARSKSDARPPRRQLTQAHTGMIGRVAEPFDSVVLGRPDDGRPVEPDNPPPYEAPLLGPIDQLERGE